MSRHLQDAVVTTLGYADPLTGELLKAQNGLADPVAYYKRNARNSPFSATDAMITFKRYPPSRKVKFALQSPSKLIDQVDWDFGDTTTRTDAGRRVSKTYTAAGTYEVEAEVTYTAEPIVTGFTITNQGSGYATPPTITISAPQNPGATATATASLSGGLVNNIALTYAGYGYTSAPTVTVSAPPALTAATATSSVNAGGVTGVTVTSGGANYVTAPTVTFTGGGGTGATGTATVSGGAVTGVTVTAAGTGYSTAPTVVFAGGGGVQAVVTAQIDTGGSETVTVEVVVA